MQDDQQQPGEKKDMGSSKDLPTAAASTTEGRRVDVRPTEELPPIKPEGEENVDPDTPVRPPQQRAKPAMKPEEVDLASVNALVVEDDAGGMAIIGVMMRFLNIKSYINTTGEGVVQMAKAMKPGPDIIFLDLNLPRTTGYDVLKEIRAEPSLVDIPVIAVTAQDADTEIPKTREAGFNGYIGKPLNRLRFPRQLRRILAGEEVWETY